LRKHVSSKCCYHASPIDNAKVTDQKSQVAFRVEIWTLLEKRSIKTTRKVYENEEVPGQAFGSLLDEKYGSKPKLTVLNSKTTESIPIKETQKKVACSKCKGQGKLFCVPCNGTGKETEKECTKCKGKGSHICKECSMIGYFLERVEMESQWQTVYSVTYPKNTTLPDKVIKEARGKANYFEGDDFCANQSIQSTFNNLTSKANSESSLPFYHLIEEQFKENHMKKTNPSTQIRRIKCMIQRIDILEINYQTEKFVNKTGPKKGESITKCTIRKSIELNF
jgi:hypothetical protein